ncbi:protein NO VEIN domain-containing protein [Mitsuokella jalaludinii]|uniref:protein NO VEIN domain-containing protein n=1 Tax=Mitsuokella jalaludinii TaxID=187979 RepID=UPI00298BE0A9|nr:DUF3883 domain-containing protein [Mitsuokella jalaludinii]
MNTYVSVNIISSALLVLKEMVKHGCMDVESVNHLYIPYTEVNRGSALDFAEQCKWIILDEKAIVLSDFGKYIVSSFDEQSISKEMWRDILKQYIDACEPAWGALATFGRKSVYLMANVEEQRCFQQAGLMDDPDDSIVRWWDDLASKYRAKKDAVYTEIGRIGEKLTIEYEHKRTGNAPVWKALDSNKDGFDVQSVVSSTDRTILRIEVKTSKARDDMACVYITANEWAQALTNSLISPYQFHLWKIGKENSIRLAVLDIKEIKKHVPTNNGFGEWQEVKIPMNCFETEFSTIEGL